MINIFAKVRQRTLIQAINIVLTEEEMKLMFQNGQCVDPPKFLADDPLPEMVLWREAVEKEEYVRLTFRLVDVPGNGREVPAEVFRSLTVLLARYDIMPCDFSLNTLKGGQDDTFVLTAETWSLRLYPLHEDVGSTVEWTILRKHLVSFETELFIHQKAQPL